MVKYILINNKKGQVWSLDLAVAGLIFSVGIIFLIFYSINYNPTSQSKLDEMFYEGSLISELLLSEDESGILSGGVINQTKLNKFDSLTSNEKKNLLGINNNFYVLLYGFNNDSRIYFGIINTSIPGNLIKINRLAIYKNKPSKFEVFVWK